MRDDDGLRGASLPPASLADALRDGVEPASEAALAGTGAATRAAAGGRVRLTASAWAWAGYEGARTPHVILNTIYVFAPYFATVVIGDPVRGQQVIANTGVIGGLLTALTAPLLGASIDGFGPRKPALAFLTLLMIPMIASFWFIRPAGEGMPLSLAVTILTAVGVLFAWTEVLHNSMLPIATDRRSAPYASGLAYSLANGVSVLMLLGVLWAFALPGKVGWSFVPAHPLLGLDPAKHEADRIVGPLVALVFALGAWPLFVFTPDARRTGIGLANGLRQGVATLRGTLATLRGDRDGATFLASRMLYTDGMTAVLIFGGVYAAGVMRWGVLELLAYGVLLSIFAVIGGFVGAALDRRLGPKTAIRIEIGVIICTQIGILGLGRERLFYAAYPAAAHAPLWNGPMFRTLPELVWLAIGAVGAVFITASYASSRTLLARIAPTGREASYFGLYALSGTATVWIGSLLVKISTAVFKSQQGGFAPIVLLLTLGLIGMMFVKGGRREA